MSKTAMMAAIWDMDGTLVDTAGLHFAAWQEMGAALGRPFTQAHFTATFGRRNPEIIHEIFGTQFSAAEIDELGHRKEELYKTAAQKQGVVLLPGVRALLEGLRAAGFRQGVGSSAPRGNLDLILRLTGVASFFDTVVSMEDTQRGKPDPQVFLMAAQRLGAAPERCVVFEDAPAGIQAAKAGGMKCVAVRFVGHHSEQTLRAAGADRVEKNLEVVSAKEVVRLLKVT